MAMATNFLVESWTYLGIGILVVFGRVWARLKSGGLRSLAFDDYLMMLAIVLYAAETATAYYVGAYWSGLANSGMTPEGRRNLDPASHEYYLRTHGAQTQLFGWLVYTALLWALKLCWLFFYQRLGEGVDRMALKINVGFFLCGVTFFGTFLTILLKCQPISKNWQIYPDPGNWCQPAVSRLQAYVLITTNITTDLYIMSIPLPMVWSVRISPFKKLALVGIFCGGIITTVFGILRCTFILLDRPDGPQIAGEWSCRESFVAVFISNAPVMYPLLYRVFNHVKTSVYSRSRSQSRLQSGGKDTGTKGSESYKMSSLSRPSRGKRIQFKHPLSLPGETFYEQFGSEEDIVGRDAAARTEMDLGEKDVAGTKVMLNNEAKATAPSTMQRPLKSEFEWI